jgi:hypothetical protein
MTAPTTKPRLTSFAPQFLVGEDPDGYVVCLGGRAATSR